MTLLHAVNAAIVAIGVPAIVAALVMIGRKLEILDSLKKEIDDNVRPDLKDVRERLATLEGRTSGLFDSHSPISLTDAGERHLLESGLKQFIDDNADRLLEECDHDVTMKTPYDVQQVAFDFFSDYVLPDELDSRVKTYAYNQGISMDALRRVAGIYFRDIALKAHDFNQSQLD